MCLCPFVVWTNQHYAVVQVWLYVWQYYIQFEINVMILYKYFDYSCRGLVDIWFYMMSCRFDPNADKISIEYGFFYYSEFLLFIKRHEIMSKPGFQILKSEIENAQWSPNYLYMGKIKVNVKIFVQDVSRVRTQHLCATPKCLSWGKMSLCIRLEYLSTPTQGLKFLINESFTKSCDKPTN